MSSYPIKAGFQLSIFNITVLKCIYYCTIAKMFLNEIQDFSQTRTCFE